jgi:hypothetical protein
MLLSAWQSVHAKHGIASEALTCKLPQKQNVEWWQYYCVKLSFGWWWWKILYPM